ncbi:MAG: GGDEF domain-containing protein [Gemmatimonadetes bacterium]|nr:GGDEF domain-containing protein [Gemmatimonadota bacterium]
MRKERLTYRDLLRRLLSGPLLRLEERRRVEESLAVPDDLEVAGRLAGLLEDLAHRGAIVRLASRPGDPRNLRRYQHPTTGDYWSIEAPGPRAVHEGRKRVPQEEPTEPAAPAPARDSMAREEPASVPPPPIPEPEPAPAPPRVPEPRLVLPVEQRRIAPGVATRFRNDLTGEPHRTLFSTFAPCASPEELADALAPIRAQAIACTTATEVRFHVIPEEGGAPEFLPIHEKTAPALLDLEGRVQSAVLEGREVLHVPNLKALGVGAPAGREGAAAILPLSSGERPLGAMEVARATPGPFEDDELSLFALCAEVVSGLLVRADVLEKLIFVDRLTGLYNRAYFDDQIEREIERANRMGTSVALLMADVDHFKRINDTHGHQIGDQALAHVAAIVRSNIRQIDVAARYGGEEFAILLPSITRARASRTAERLRRVVADTPFGETIPALGGQRVSISVGFALYPDDAATAKQLIERADRVALYAAKNNGRNRVVPWSEARDQRVRVRTDR